MNVSGIYSITNTNSGKVYYGSSNNVNGRWRNHKSKLNKNIHPNPHLQNAWNKYGGKSFRFNIEEEIPSEQLQTVEQCYLEWCKIFPRWSYNIGYDAECATRGLKFGLPSKEHRRKIGLANSGSNSVNYGKKMSDETRKRMSVSKRGVPKPPRTEEHKRNMSFAKKGKYYDLKNYKFLHPIHGIEICDRHTLISKYGLYERGVGLLIQRRRRTHKGWRICYE
jgi:group I intron endonuclease